MTLPNVPDSQRAERYKATIVPKVWAPGRGRFARIVRAIRDAVRSHVWTVLETEDLLDAMPDHRSDGDGRGVIRLLLLAFVFLAGVAVGVLVAR